MERRILTQGIGNVAEYEWHGGKLLRVWKSWQRRDGVVEREMRIRSRRDISREYSS